MATQFNNSLIHGIACLQMIASAPRPVGSRELARQLGMTHTRVSRLLATLARIGLVARTAQRKYRPGPAVHVLAAQSVKGSRLFPAALPHLMQLHAEGLTVALGVLWRQQVCYLFHRRPWQSLETAIGVHELHPARRSSLGMALLAASTTPEEADESLAADIARIRRDGYAVVRYPGGEVSVGAAIGQPPFAGLAVSGQFDEPAIAPMGRRLQDLAAQIAAIVQADAPNQ